MLIKPFCVMSAELTDEELNVMLKKCIEFGAMPFEWFGESGKTPFEWLWGFAGNDLITHHRRDMFRYWGVHEGGITYTSDSLEDYCANLSTKEEAFKMLEITKTCNSCYMEA